VCGDFGHQFDGCLQSNFIILDVKMCVIWMAITSLKMDERVTRNESGMRSSRAGSDGRERGGERP
jgi:hypothetical protein